MTAARLFVALWPTPAERAALATWMGRCRWPPHAAVVAPARLHLTLHFLGDVPRERIAELHAALAAPIRRTTLRFDRAAVWRSGVAVVEPSAAPAALAGLHAGLGERLRGLGLTPEPRRFRPHVTLARHAQGAWLADPGDDLRWRPARVVLVESLRGARPAYRIVSRA